MVAGVAAKAVLGAPFSGIVITENTQTLADGNRIVHTNRETLYRDGVGRERRELDEVTFSVLGQRMAAGSVVIFDPVANASYSLDLQGLTAIKRFAQRSWPGGLQILQAEAGARFDREVLPAAAIEGVYAQGKRTTSTIPAGKIGNERDIVVIDEAWYSPELQMNVMTRHSDPRGSETILRLTNIKRSEPDPGLFQVPKGYTITDQTEGVRVYR